MVSGFWGIFFEGEGAFQLDLSIVQTVHMEIPLDVKQEIAFALLLCKTKTSPVCLSGLQNWRESTREASVVDVLHYDCF